MSSLGKLKKKIRKHYDKVNHEKLAGDMAEARAKGEIPQLDTDIQKELNRMNFDLDNVLKSTEVNTTKLLTGEVPKMTDEKKVTMPQMQAMNIQDIAKRLGLTDEQFQVMNMLQNATHRVVKGKLLTADNMQAFLCSMTQAISIISSIPVDNELIKIMAEQQAVLKQAQAEPQIKVTAPDNVLSTDLFAKKD